VNLQAMQTVESVMSGKPRQPHLRFTRGFTLLELAVVMFLIGLVLTIAMPYFASVRTSQMRSEARRLASRANYLYEEAGAQKVILRLNFDFANNGYFVTRLDPFAANPAFRAENGPAGVRIAMPQGIKIRDVTVEGLGTFARGVVSAQFYPGGYVDATLIHLADDSGEIYSLAIDPFSGHVSIVHGDVQPNRRSRTYR
jgi:prepilin-type N-terminal cleavage/methylation domain-containing protein